MLAFWTNDATVTLACRAALFGGLLIAITSAGSWLIERWSGERG